jgi:hypothetical protein
MTRAGHGLWIIRIAITKQLSRHALWHIGVRVSGKLRVVSIRLSS